MSDTLDDYHYLYLPGQSTNTFLLLHGTGGNEHDLVSIGQQLDSQANIVSPRGKVRENGLPRFFKRLGKGVYDLPDLQQQTQDLANFIVQASQKHQFNLHQTCVVGYSNGANIATHLLLQHPNLITTAILFRPLYPLQPANIPHLSNANILIIGGQTDPIIPTHQTDNLYQLLQKTTATVTLNWQPSGHQLTNQDIVVAKDWLHPNTSPLHLSTNLTT